MESNLHSDPLLQADEFADLLHLGKTAIQQMACSDLQPEEFFSRMFSNEYFKGICPVTYKDPYQIIVDNLPHMVLLKNLDSVYLTCNEQLLKFLNISQPDIIGKTDMDLFPEDLALKFRYEDKLTLEQGIPRQYIQEYTQNDRKIYLQITKIPIKDRTGKFLGILGILFEISDNVTFKEILDQGKFQNDLLVENNHDVFYRIDFSGFYNYISQNIIRLTGFSQNEQLIMSHEDRIERESISVFYELMNFYLDAFNEPAKEANRLKYYRKVDLELKTKDGKSVWVESVNNLYFGRTGKAKGIVGMYRNINDRKMLEFQVQEMLEKSNKISQSQSQIISTISHEFKTPISVLQSNLQLLSQRRSSLDDNLLNDIFDLSMEAVKALNQTLNNIGFLAKNQKGAFNLAKQEINLDQFVKSLIRELLCIPEYKGRIICSIELNQSQFQLDPAMIKHILSNLLINGLNYSPPDKKVRLTIIERQDHIFFSIKDKGIGIPEEDIDRIFESFYRAGNVSGIKGTGLGLAIVKECITLLGGKIKVYSKTGEGTEVEFIIPLNNG